MALIHSGWALRDRLAHGALCFLDRFRRDAPIRLATVRCKEFPVSRLIAEQAIWVTQVGRVRKWASFRCPGQCGKIVRLRLASSESPHWTVTTDWLGRITVAPSIRQLTSCGCHFWVRRGRVQWCSDTPEVDRITTVGPASARQRQVQR